jgi:uncharacterized protein (TIGR02646 family)
MKHVSKGRPPAELEDWKALANADWQPAYADLQNPQKLALHRCLLAEQGWVCCYCGRRISQGDSHIEHFRPQKSHPDLALSYDNLHASCLRETPRPETPQPALPLPLHCGHAKGGRFDADLHVSPLDPGCEGRFVYTLLGQMAPRQTGDPRASYMVELLQLDIAFLRNRRKAVLGHVFDAEFLGTATAEELRRLRDAAQDFGSDGQAPDFGHVLACFAQQRLNDAADA